MQSETTITISVDASQCYAAMKNVADRTEKETDRARAAFDKTNKKMEQLQKRTQALGRMTVSPTRLVDRVSSPLRNIESKLSRLSTVKKIPIEAVDKTTSIVQRITGALTSPLALLGGGAGAAASVVFPLNLAGEMARSRNAVINYSSSIEEGKKNFEDLVNYAIKSPVYEVPFATQMGGRLLTLTKDINFTKRALESFGNSMLYTGATTDGLKLAFRGFTQIATKGKLQVEELYQVTENLGVPLQWITEELGITGDELSDLGRLGISAKDAMEGILRTLEKRYPKANYNNDLLALASNTKETARVVVWQFGEGMAQPVIRILQDLTGTLDPTGDKFVAFSERVKNAGKQVGEFFERSYNWIKELFSDEKFQGMSPGDKFVYIIDRGLDDVIAYINGDGGEKVGSIFTKLGEIAARAWWTGLTGMASGSAQALMHGNIMGAIGLAAGASLLGGGMLVRGAWGAGKGLVNAGKWAAGRMGLTGAAEAGTAAAEEAATATRGADLLPRLGILGRMAGKVVIPLGVGLDVLSVARARPEEQAKKIGGLTGRWTGMFAGAKLGAMGGAAVGSAIPGVGTAIGGGVGGFLGGIAGFSGGGAIGEKIGANLKRMKTVVATKFSEIKNSAITAVQQMGINITDWFSQLPERAGYAVGYIVGWFSGLPGRISIFVQQLPGIITTWFSQAWSSATQWASQTVADIGVWWSSLPDRVSEWWSGVTSAVDTWAHSSYTSVVN
ncbi:MAG: hypothetical protein A4E52_00438 [Pelotomaculum sp. PtaB.Bin013]|uniref:Tape measure protein n=1 Tax=Pelotomaculum isophthalicicum JI TaxID=947010 RepID=A0A9X4H5N3_9FIRM|nr:tape measure protein [Pelotomaculum isophthalicicum]MDF9408273.1 tape measure protein [Pelotomaculum isophthalicicum JI]OPX91619.1 MAG: hypothetical protein A4E52_00438 [Pelotomaculum sp. PtaB.Bin013]